MVCHFNKFHIGHTYLRKWIMRYTKKTFASPLKFAVENRENSKRIIQWHLWRLLYEPTTWVRENRNQKTTWSTGHVNLNVGELRAVCNHPDKFTLIHQAASFAGFKYCDNGDIFLIYQVTYLGRPCDQRIMWFYGLKHLKVKNDFKRPHN